MNGNTNVVIDEMLRSIQYMIDKAMSKTTQCYDGLVLSNAGNGKWNIMYNGETHAIKGYGVATPSINTVVKVIIPQGNQALAWFFVPIDGSGGGGGGTSDGIYYTPSVSDEGIISWTNNGGLPNPNPVDIMGPEGPAGEDGADGQKGDTGPYYTPSVSDNGDLSWTNNGNLSNPPVVNIKGPQGDIGPQGPAGPVGPTGENGANGADATINGVNALTLTATDGITGTQSGNTYTLSAKTLQTALNNITNGTTKLNYLPLTGGTLTGDLLIDSAHNLQVGSGNIKLYTDGETSWVDIGNNTLSDEAGNDAIFNINTANGISFSYPSGAAAIFYGQVKSLLPPVGIYDLTNKQYVDNAVANAGSSPITAQFSGTLPTSGWVAENGQYYYQVSISNITANDVPLVIPQWTNQSTEELVWNNLTSIQSYAGYVRFYSTAAFTVAINYIMYY